MSLYRALHRAVNRGLVHSCHTPALGGLAPALARTALAGGLGLDVDLGRVPGTATSDLSILYSESNSRFLVGVAPEAAAEFESCLKGQPCARIGSARADEVLRISGRDGGILIEQSLAALRSAWKEALGDF